MQFELDGEKVTGSGHIDAFEPESATIYDLKISRFVRWQAEKGFIPRRRNQVSSKSGSGIILDRERQM